MDFSVLKSQGLNPAKARSMYADLGGIAEAAKSLVSAIFQNGSEEFADARATALLIASIRSNEELNMTMRSSIKGAELFKDEGSRRMRAQSINQVRSTRFFFI